MPSVIHWPADAQNIYDDAKERKSEISLTTTTRIWNSYFPSSIFLCSRQLLLLISFYFIARGCATIVLIGQADCYKSSQL